MQALHTYLTDRQTGPIFLNHRGTRLTDRSVRRILKSLGFENVSPHTLRHTYATNILDRGIDVRALQELLGHRSITSTQLYTQVSTAHKQREYKKFHPRSE